MEEQILEYLIIPYDEFNKKVSIQIKEAEKLSTITVANDEEYQEFSRHIKEWTLEARSIFKDNFNLPDNAYAQGFEEAGRGYNFPRLNTPDLREKVKTDKNKLLEKKNYLEYGTKLIGISDVISKPGTIDMEARRNFSTQEKLELLLNKLYDLKDGRYWDTGNILAGNGINQAYPGEYRELGDMLSNQNYVEKLGNSSGLSLKLNLQGKMYVEEKIKERKASSNKTSTQTETITVENRSDIIEKVDEILKHLEMLGLGHELLYEEIQDLKSDSNRVNKKDLRLLLLGKLLENAAPEEIWKDKSVQDLFNYLAEGSRHLNPFENNPFVS